jgi:ABC-2 type transport system permease protein
MRRLVAAELNRLLSRRLTLVLSIAVVAVVALFQLVVVESVTPPSPEEVAAARQGYEQYRQEWEQNHEQWEQECLESNGPDTDCTIPAPSERDFGLAPTPFAEIAGGGATFAVVVAMLAAFLLAASFIGAEYSSGSLGNWLIFVPQRERVYAAKAVALAITAAVLGTGSGLLMVGLSSLVTLVIGQPLTGLGGVAATAARGIPLVVFAALVGFCVALLSRHTVAALGALLGYGLLVLGLNIVNFLVPASSLLKRWQLETNIQAFLSYGHEYQVIERLVSEDGVSIQGSTRTLDFGASVGYLTVLLVVLLGVALLVFRRRDVT